MKKKWFFICLAVILVIAAVALIWKPWTAATLAAESDALNLSESYEKADLSAYLGDGEHAFYRMTVRDMKEQYEKGESFVIAFGFAGCGQCRAAVPVLNDVAMENGLTVGYVNTRENPAWMSNKDIDDYDLLLEMISELLAEDIDGDKHLYVPAVFFVRDGEIIYHFVGTGGASNGDLTLEQRDLLAQRYQTGADLLLTAR